MTHPGSPDQEDDDYFGDLPIAKWLNNRSINHEVDLNYYNLNQCSTSNTISIEFTDNDAYEDIEQLSISLQVWSLNTMKYYFSKWKNHTLNKLNILHIKYRNYQYIHHRKILFEYFKKWRILQQNYTSTIMSLSHWVHSVQSNYFKEWQQYTFETAPKSRIIVCNRIKQFLRFWRVMTLRINAFSNHYNVITNKHKLLQLQMAWIKWIFVQKYHAQMLEIKKIIIQNSRRQCVSNAIKTWREMYERSRKLKQLKLRIICKQFFLWWHLQCSLSIHYNNVYTETNYHSLHQSLRNAFAYWYRKRLHKAFKRWRVKHVYIESLRCKSLRCRQFHRNNTRKLYYAQWKELYETTTMMKILTISNYFNDWREFKATQNIKRQNMLESHVFYVRNVLLKCYDFWKIETKQCVHARLSQGKADMFYKSKIIKKYVQIAFGQWLLISIQQKDIKQKIETKYKRNMWKKYWCLWILQYEYKQITRQFRIKWNKTKDYDLCLKMFISWKKQCKYPISLLHKKREIEDVKRDKIFRSWYLTLYKRHKLSECQVIAQNCSIQSAFIRWKVTMKHHLLRKRNEIYVRKKHQHSQMVIVVVYWREYVVQKQNIVCHKKTLNKICDTFIFEKRFREWYHSYQLSLRFKSAKQLHIHNTLRIHIGYWLEYNRHLQKHQYMMHIAHHEYNQSVLIKFISYWSEYKRDRISMCIQYKLAKQFMERKYIKYWKHETMSHLSLTSRMDGFTTTLETKYKTVAFKQWKMYHLKQSKLKLIKSEIETQREIYIISTLFNGWFRQSEEKRTLRLLNDHAIGLHKDKVLTRVFVHWITILPLLKREHVQLMKPQLIFNFYRWRNVSAYNNNVRDKCYDMLLRKIKRHFSVYREYTRFNMEQRKKGYTILNAVHTVHQTCIGFNRWRAITSKHKHNTKLYTMIKHKYDKNKRNAIINEWKLLHQVSGLAKGKQLSHCYKIWRKQYGYRQMEARIMYDIYYHGMKQNALNEWKTLWTLRLNQRKSFELMLQNTNTKQKRYFFVIWCIGYKWRLLQIKSSREHIRIRIHFWRIYSRNKIKMREDISKIKSVLTDKWEFNPSSIYEKEYIPSIAHSHIHHEKRIQISSNNKLMIDTDYLMEPTKKQIMRHILLKWKYFVVFNAFKRWKSIVEMKKEENRLMQFAEYSFKQKCVGYVICIWKHRVNVKKLYHILSDSHHIKQTRFAFIIWQSVYKYSIMDKQYSKQQCISYWSGLILKRKQCDTACVTITTNKPIHRMRTRWNQWYRLFLLMNQIRNDNNNADFYYYKLLIRNCFHTWNRSFVTKSIIGSLIDNAFIQDEMNVKRRILREWLSWYQGLKAKSIIASEIYTQNTLKHYFDYWKAQLFEKWRNLKWTLTYWKYMTHSNKDLAIKELRFYHSRLLPHLFILWKQYTQNKRISRKYYYYKTLQKYMKHWKIYNKGRQRIYSNMDSNFKSMKMQRTKHHMNGWHCFAVKYCQINRIAVVLIEKRDGIKFLSTNNLSSISFRLKPRFEIIQNEAKLLQNQAFGRWRYFYERNQKIKYFFRLIRLERFIAEWREYRQVQNKKKYLMSKLPIIAKNASMKKHFNLWRKTFKKHQTLRNIYYRVSNRQQFNLMKNMFISFRDYIYNEKQKRFILKRLVLCKYVTFWSCRARKRKEYTRKEEELNHKYKLKLQLQTFTQWAHVFKDNLVSFHLCEFEMSYCRSYYLHIWSNITMKNKINLFRTNQWRKKMKQCIGKWKRFVITKHKISEMEHIALRYYCMNTYCNVWSIWHQHLFDKYIIINSQSILKTFHVQYLLNKWRIHTESKKICKGAREILCDYERKRTLMQSFNDWRKHCVAKRHYEIYVVKSSFGQWISVYIEILNMKRQQNAMRQILFVWHNYTQNCIQYDQEKIEEIELKQLLRHFRFWMKSMELKQYLFEIYTEAARYHINNLISKGINAFKQHQKKMKLQQEQFERIKHLRQRILIKNAMNIMLYQWHCVTKAITFKHKYELEEMRDLFCIWYCKWKEMNKMQKRLKIAESHYRHNKLGIVIHDWLVMSRSRKQSKRYLIHAQNKHNRQLYKDVFLFWYKSFKNISTKKQRLYQLQLSWNKRKRNHIFLCWNNTVKAHGHYQSWSKLQCMMSWKLLYQYHIAARYEREKNIHLCVSVFNKWNNMVLKTKEKEMKLNECLEVFVDWKKEKVLKEWRNIYDKQQKAAQLYAFNVQKRIFKMYIECVHLSYIETEEFIDCADNYCQCMTLKRFYYFWVNRQERIVERNEYLNGKCNKYLVQKRKKRLRSLFKHLSLVFRHAVNERQDIHISAQYRNNYVLSKFFVEWKLYIKTKKYKNKLLTKSLSSLRQSVMRNNGFRNKISLSHSYIRLSNSRSNTASILKSDELNHLSMFRNEERYNDDDYDSVLLKTPIVDSYD